MLREGSDRAPLATAAATAPRVIVTGRRPRLLTPLPGVALDAERAATHVQSAGAAELRDAQSRALTDFLASQFQSVSVNDYQGNPFQQDLVFRGFSASPLIGTPQGVSVYLDGIRVNEPFGEVVNWDLIPLAALERMDLIPGASPLFGLNTLGGALALTTKSGFSAPRVEALGMVGSHGLWQAQLAAGGNDGTLAGFVAANRWHDDGWRDLSASDVAQAYLRGDWRGELAGRGASATTHLLAADNRLIGNGLLPVEEWARRAESVFTAPDETRNRLTQWALRLSHDLSDDTALSLQLYRRQVQQHARGGDFWEEFRTAASRLLPACPDGVSVADGAIGVDLPGCPGLLPNGVYNFGHTEQDAHGVQLQLSGQHGPHQWVLGATHDRNAVRFGQSQRLGFIDASREVLLAPERYDELGLTALVSDIQRNQLRGRAHSSSLFAYDSLQATPSLVLELGLRLNVSGVENQLVADRPIPLYQFDVNLARRLEDRCGAEAGVVRARWYCTQGDYSYRSVNPSLGAAWTVQPGLIAHGGFSRGTRVPSTIELGCARDREAEKLAGGGRNTGRTPGCSIPTALSADPYLPQVVAYNLEAGLRGGDGRTLAWNFGLYHSELHHDILFVSMGARNRGVFDTFGRTRRAGLELGAEGRLGAQHRWRASWAHVRATFESRAEVVNLSNSSASKTVGQVNTFVIEPGDEIPGIPRDSLRLGWQWQSAAQQPRWQWGLTMLAHAGVWVRGNENNAHQPEGSDSNGSATLGTLDPSITTEPGRRYVGQGRTGGYAVFHLTARWQPSPRWWLDLRVDNLFDRRYATAGELGLNPYTESRWGQRDAAGFNHNSNDWTHSTMVGLGAPRSLQLSLNWRLDA